MTPAVWAILAVLIVFATLVAYNYIRDLRRERDAARENADTAWRLYEQTDRELCALLGRSVPTQTLADAKQPPRQSRGFRPTAIGPTAIRDRELRRELEEEGEGRAPIDGIHPSDAHDAAREAMANS